ncbi:MAG: hypothetical protein ACPGGN_06585 [Opitutales bacterium]
MIASIWKVVLKYQKTNATAKHGFALVIALSLMAFILVLVLSMSLFVQVESASSSTALAQLRAKESAKLALFMALGDLQKHAGPDQRVTARAEILGSGDQLPESKLWTGVWDTTDPAADPFWLVSGNVANPSQIDSPVQLQVEYDHNDDGSFDSDFDVPATKAPAIDLDSGYGRIAWWISDEGVKAPIRPVSGVFEEIGRVGNGTPIPDYFGYSERTIRSAAFQHDPVFDFLIFNDDFPDIEKLFDITDSADSVLDGIEKAESLEEIAILIADFPPKLRDQVLSEFLHSSATDNLFVLTNTKDGGLKKDLSFLKTIDLDSVTLSQLDTLYNDPDNYITPELARALFTDFEPIAGDASAMLGMQIPRDTISAVEAAPEDFSILPVITEFQLSAGIAADDQSASGEVYFVHKVYVELWNPYTVPFVVGKTDLASEQGFSDIRIEIANLPTFTITNDTSGESVSGSIPDQDYLFSSEGEEKILRPGMVYYRTLPRDSAGDEDSGAYHTPLGIELSGVNSDGYTGAFSMSGPIEITFIAVSSSGDEKEIYRFVLDGYPDFEIDYGSQSSDRATWFNRRRTSENGQFGMNNESLERLGYAFGFRFKMLDSQNSETLVTDISNWLSLRDPRRRSFSVDLATWDINSAWEDPSTPPYDFRLSSNDFDPGLFHPNESFKSDDFFYYKTFGSGRRDRIARFFNLPTGEPTRLDLLNAISYQNVPPNPIGNPWGDDRNALYDRYFFSTLPDPSSTDVDVFSKPLLNARLKILDSAPVLDGVDSAENFLVENGFNLNSTSPLAWAKVLSGNQFAASALEMQYEQGNFPDEPEWFSTSNSIANGIFKFPEAAAFNTTEQHNSPRYELILRENVSAYETQFSIDSVDWRAERQFPAFIQNLREMQRTESLELGRAIVDEIKRFHSNNGHPPMNLEDYLSSGLIQTAINETPSLNQRENGFDEIPTFVPANIDQRAILNMLAGFASVRSDTFRITARADITDPLTGTAAGTMFCRARVQRLPLEHDNPNFGRKFNILEIEWDSSGFD